ncbi:putative mitochondrial fission protein ELM1 [Helianthus anomalus]
MDDLRNYEVKVTDALEVNTMGFNIFGMPAPSSGTLGLALVSLYFLKCIDKTPCWQNLSGWASIGGCMWQRYHIDCKLHKKTSIVFVVQIQHPRTQLNRFDLVVAPQHDYYALTAHAQEQVPRLFRKCITGFCGTVGLFGVIS